MISKRNGENGIGAFTGCHPTMMANGCARGKSGGGFRCADAGVAAITIDYGCDDEFGIIK